MENASTNSHEGYSWRYNAYYNGTYGVSIKDKKSIGDYFTVYPNPSNDYLSINYIGVSNYNQFNAKIYDINGRLVKSQDDVKLNQYFSISNLEFGSYIFVIEVGNHKVVKQFIKGN